MENSLDSSVEDRLERDLIDAAFVDAAKWGSSECGQRPARRELFSKDAIPGYELIRESHRGGQGIIYQAIQKSTRRQVAIKAMREAHFAGPRDRARFEREVHILGHLQHPHIVTIHDSGQAGGCFYLAMDYIDGLPLDAYIRSLASSPPQLGFVRSFLELFAKICDAVNAAHLRGVIHRDLKPSNILVDTEGAPRILDFGLSKWADTGSSAESIAASMTQTGQFVGSLQWASPEQAEGEGPRVDTRTDVYSLGVILYQALTNRFPYPVAGSVRETLNHIVHTAPARPGKLTRRVDDELETVILKCLAKEPEHRYQSAGELARELRHYLDGEPIEAKRDSLWYLLKKAAVRHWVRVTIAASFVLVLIGSTTALTFMYQQAQSSRRLAWSHLETAHEAQRAEARSRQIAQQRFDQIRGLAHTFIFDFHDQIASLTGATPARELLVKTALSYLDNLAKEAGEDRGLLQELAEAYSKVGDVQGNPLLPNLGDTKGSLGSYQKALAIRQSLANREPRDSEVVRGLLACHNQIGDVQLVMGHSEEALSSYREGLLLAQKLVDADSSDAKAQRELLVSYAKIGDIQVIRKQIEEAIESRRKSLSIATTLAASAPANSPAQHDLMMSFFKLGDTQEVAGKYPEALENYRNSLARAEALSKLSPNDARAVRDVFMSCLKIGDVYRLSGPKEQALPFFQRCVEIETALTSSDPKNVQAQRELAMSWVRLGMIHRDLGRMDEAMAALQKNLDLANVLVQIDHDSAFAKRDLAYAFAQLGELQRATGRFDEAFRSYERDVEISASLAKADPGDVDVQIDAASAFSDMAQLHKEVAAETQRSAVDRLKHWREARSWFQQCLDINSALRDRGALPPTDTGVPNQLLGLIAACDKAIADLN